MIIAPNLEKKPLSQRNNEINNNQFIKKECKAHV